LNPKSIIAEVVRKKDHVLRVSGAAWTDLSGVKAVEVQVDGAAWAPAELETRRGCPKPFRKPQRRPGSTYLAGSNVSCEPQGENYQATKRWG
jgi:hypothetical protein